MPIVAISKLVKKNKFKPYSLKNNFAIILIALSIVYCFSSCNAVKYVPENEHLLIKNKVYVNGEKDMDNEINDYIVQRPNQRVLTLLPFPLQPAIMARALVRHPFIQVQACGVSLA